MSLPNGGAIDISDNDPYWESVLEKQFLLNHRVGALRDSFFDDWKYYRTAIAACKSIRLEDCFSISMTKGLCNDDMQQDFSILGFSKSKKDWN